MRPIAAVALMMLIAPAWGGPDEPPHPALGATMPEFTLFDLQQRMVRLSEIAEPVVVINFFAFWCDTWIGELPQLRELVTRQDRLGFRLVAISVDGAWTNQLAEVCGEDGVPWPVLIDRDKRLSAELGLRHVPTIMVLDRSRVIRHVHEGYPGNTLLLRSIRDALSAN